MRRLDSQTSKSVTQWHETRSDLASQATRQTPNHQRRMLADSNPVTLNMRILIRLILLVLLLLLMVAAFLALPVLRAPVARDYPAELERHAGMIRLAPPNADVILIPTAGPTLRRLQRHVVTRGAIEQIEVLRDRPYLPWLVGNGDVVLWRTESESGAIANLDGPRRFLAGVFGAEVQDGLLVTGPQPGGGFRTPSIRPALSGHAFALRGRSVSAITLADTIAVRTISQRDPEVEVNLLRGNPVRFPDSAMVAAAFGATPALIHKVEETLPVEISSLLQNGGVVTLYTLQDERLLPRPRGVIILPVGRGGFEPIRKRLESLSPPLPFGIASESRREVLGQTVTRRESIGFTLEYTVRGDEVLVAFDKSSIEKYLDDTLKQFSAEGGNAEWIVRLDPRQLVPALERVADHTGLRVLVPELGRAAERALESLRWIESATEIVAIKTVRGETEELEIAVYPPK